MGEGAPRVGMRGSLFDPHPFFLLVLFFCPFFPSVSLRCSLIPWFVLLFDVLIFLPLCVSTESFLWGYVRFATPLAQPSWLYTRPFFPLSLFYLCIV